MRNAMSPKGQGHHVGDETGRFCRCKPNGAQINAARTEGGLPPPLPHLILTQKFLIKAQKNFKSSKNKKEVDML